MAIVDEDEAAEGVFVSIHIGVPELEPPTVETKATSLRTLPHELMTSQVVELRENIKLRELIVAC